ncbi:MAG: hypothetical protein JNK66_14660 [Chitinophagales bacterium]|nr:hypothetical protein [Chitinophagales bacterium]
MKNGFLLLLAMFLVFFSSAQGEQTFEVKKKSIAKLENEQPAKIYKLNLFVGIDTI